MRWKDQLTSGLKAAGAMTAVNLPILGLMVTLGFGVYPVDPEGFEMPAVAFAMGTIVVGGLIPGIIGTFVWYQIDRRWSSRSGLIFLFIAMTIATVMTLPATNPNAQTGDAFILTTVLHYSTALLGSWFIPRFSPVESID